MEEYSKTPDIISISSHNKIEILSPAEIDNLRKGSYQLLADVGGSLPIKESVNNIRGSWR